MTHTKIEMHWLEMQEEGCAGVDVSLLTEQRLHQPDTVLFLLSRQKGQGTETASEMCLPSSWALDHLLVTSTVWVKRHLLLCLLCVFLPLFFSFFIKKNKKNEE